MNLQESMSRVLAGEWPNPLIQLILLVGLVAAILVWGAVNIARVDTVSANRRRWCRAEFHATRSRRH